MVQIKVIGNQHIKETPKRKISYEENVQNIDEHFQSLKNKWSKLDLPNDIQTNKQLDSSSSSSSLNMETNENADKKLPFESSSTLLLNQDIQKKFSLEPKLQQKTSEKRKEYERMKVEKTIQKLSSIVNKKNNNSNLNTIKRDNFRNNRHINCRTEIGYQGKHSHIKIQYIDQPEMTNDEELLENLCLLADEDQKIPPQYNIITPFNIKEKENDSKGYPFHILNKKYQSQKLLGFEKNNDNNQSSTITMNSSKEDVQITNQEAGFKFTPIYFKPSLQKTKVNKSKKQLFVQ